MGGKKDQCKFTIQFNASDAHHLRVASILNTQGRRKAQFITNAVLHYIHCTNPPSLPQFPVPALDYQNIEAIVRQILQSEKINQNVIDTKDQIDETDSRDSIQEISEDVLAAIINSVDSFRIK